MTDPFRPRFGWAMPGERTSTTPGRVIRDLRDGLESIPETSATFRLFTNGDRDIITDHHPNQVTLVMMTMVGSWSVPEYLSGSSAKNRWVNPRYPHRVKYADVYVRCECGALMVRPKRGREGVATDSEHSHTDDCKRSWRIRARARLLEEREETVKRIHSLDLSVRANHARFGVEPNSDRSLSAVSDDQKIDTEAIREEAETKRLNTEAALIAMGEPLGAVGACWGVTPSTIRARIATRTDWDLSELRSMDYEP